MAVISVCKNVIAANNKKGWIDPAPAIRVTATKSGRVLHRAHEIEICDKNGEVVARMVSTVDGKPVVKCGAKVALITKYAVREV